MIQLDEEELEILEAFEAGEFQSDMTPARKEFIEQSAAQTLNKVENIEVEISERDFAVLQRRPLKEGMPYQTQL